MHNQAHMAHQKKRTRANEEKRRKKKKGKEKGGDMRKREERVGAPACDHHFVSTFRPLLYSSPIDIVKTPSPRGCRHH
jgi:hypothetical protein